METKSIHLKGVYTDTSPAIAIHCLPFRAIHIWSSVLAIAILAIGNCLALPVYGQLPQETREVFEELIPELEPDLAALMRQAITDADPIVEFTPEQFKRFRANAANPFSGLEQIDVDQLEGNIALKFELPTARNRQLGELEKQSSSVLSEFESATERVRESVVKLLAGEQQIALGTVLTRDGYLLTKASQLDGVDEDDLWCVLNDGTSTAARIIGREPRNDFAILKIDGHQVEPISITKADAKPGSFVVTCVSNGRLALGISSTAARSLLPANPAYLGLRPIDSISGVRVESLTPGGAADAAGIRAGDLLEKVDGQPIGNVTQLITLIRQQQPGNKIEIQFRRNGVVGKAKAQLRGRPQPLVHSEPTTTQHGAELSRRREHFPLVFQHDTPLLPEQCGGPLVDVDGNVVGINIARHGRIGCYAVPIDHAKNVIDQMMRRDVASRK